MVCMIIMMVTIYYAVHSRINEQEALENETKYIIAKGLVCITLIVYILETIDCLHIMFCMHQKQSFYHHSAKAR